MNSLVLPVRRGATKLIPVFLRLILCVDLVFGPCDRMFYAMMLKTFGMYLLGLFVFHGIFMVRTGLFQSQMAGVLDFLMVIGTFGADIMPQVF